MTLWLIQIYQSEQDAERATRNKDYVSAIQYHNNAITKLNVLATRILQKDTQDEFGVADSLLVLRNQITSSLNRLQTLIKAEQLKKTGTGKTESSPGKLGKFSKSTTGINTTPLKESSSSPVPVLPAMENASLELFNSTLAEIETSLLKNLNIRISNVPNNTKNYKFSMINKQEINQTEHSLQLLNFKGSDDLKLRNEYLTKLNMLYYSEMLAEQEVIKDVVSSIKDFELGMENNKKWTKINQINDESVFQVIGELQHKISGLERDKLHMENEIVRLKERWNNLVEGARRRKEQEKEFLVGRTETSPATFDHEYDDKK